MDSKALHNAINPSAQHGNDLKWMTASCDQTNPGEKSVNAPVLWVNFAVGIDGIEISEDQKWLYIASMTHSRLCRAPMSVVLNPSTSSEAFNLSLEVVGQEPMSDGIATAKNGRVILTDVEHGGIMTFNLMTKRLSTLGRSKDIVWPDGVVVGADNSVYFTDSSIPSYIDQFVRPPKEAKLQEHLPYFIYFLKTRERCHLTSVAKARQAPENIRYPQLQIVEDLALADA